MYTEIKPYIIPEVQKDFKSFKELLQYAKEYASKQTHYHKLNDWSDIVHGYVHEMLHKYGFVNGNPKANETNTAAQFWWTIYKKISNLIYSKYLVTIGAHHHASAYERNEALIKELEPINF